ncbi:MAG: hypothetical protein HKN04_12015 [Rhodothermaceae bacterium]|nr:hypothetical protein [Rhodothermaceae bacterium]
MRPLALIALLTVPLLVACDSGEDDGFSLVGTTTSVAEIAGTWTATRATFSSAAEGPALEVDIIAEGGSAKLAIQTDGRFTLTLAPLGEADDVSNGRLGFDEELLVVSFDEDPDEFEFFTIQVTETTLSLEGPAEFDFDGDGVEESARVALDLIRS